MKRAAQEEGELPTLPLDIILSGILSLLRLESVREIFGLLRICKTVRERSNELLPFLVKGWSDRILKGENWSEEYQLMTRKHRDFTLTKEAMSSLLEREKEAPSENFPQNLFDYQKFVLECEWMKQKIHVREELIMDIHKEGKRQRQIKDLFHFDGKSEILTPLLEYPGLSCVDMEMDIYSLKYDMISLVEEMTKKNEVLMRYATKGIASKRSPVKRSDFYELKKMNGEPLPLLPISQNTHVSNLVLNETHIFCPQYIAPDDIRKLRNNLYSCFHNSTSYQFSDRKRTLLRHLMRDSIYRSFLEKFSIPFYSFDSEDS